MSIKLETMQVLLADVEVGDKIKFKTFDEPYEIYARNDDFIICRDVKSKEAYYTIIDVKNNKRGTHNSYGHACETKEDCQSTLKALADKEIGMSHRNIISLDITNIIKAHY